MSPSILYLLDLPAEILEQIVLHLPGQDIVKMEVISRQFQDLTRSSPALQHRRELFAAGLIDNPQNHCDLEERRRLCKKYVHKWSDAAIIEESFRDVPLGQPFSDWFYTKLLGRNLLASHSYNFNGIDFLRVPSIASGKQTEQWSIPQPAFDFAYITAYPPENILVIAEIGLARFHLLNLLDGFPYRIPPLNVIAWEIPPGVTNVSIDRLTMTGSRLMAFVYFLGEESQLDDIWVRVVLIWDWRTGDLVFERSSLDGSGLITPGCRVDFLDEFRITITHAGDTTELPIFNTLVPQGHPGNFRRFRLPQKYLIRNVSVHLDWDRSLGMGRRDEPLIVDPTQDVFIVDFLTVGQQRVFLILRTQLVIESMCSKSTDVQVSWNEWGRDAVVMDIPANRIGSSTVVHGARLLVICSTFDGPREGYQIHAFDFTRKGNGALLLG